MSFVFANSTEKNLTIAPLAAMPADSTGTIYATAAKPTLGDLSRLQYLKGQARYEFRLSAADSALEIVLVLKAGGVTIGQKTVNSGGGDTISGSVSVNLSEIQGHEELELTVTVAQAGAAGLTISGGSTLEITHPVVIGA